MSISPVTPLAAGALPPRNWTIAAWASVAALSVILTYLITLTLGVVFLAVGCFLTVVIFQAGPSIFSVMLAAFSLIVGGTVLWSMVPRHDKFKPAGVLVDLSRQERLRTELQAIARTMGEEIPAEIYLIGAANAAVSQRGGWMGFGSRRVMMIGLPLLQMLTVSQFRAVLVHEFAHFYAGDTRLGPWVFRARNNMARVITNLGQKSAILSLLTRWAVIALLYMVVVGGLVLYWKLFARITQYISRRQEFRCDELACYAAGSENLAEGLCNVNRAAAAFGLYWNQVVMPVAANGYCPQVADGFSRFMNTPAIAKVASSLLQQQLTTTKTSPLDSHPPLNARLEKARALAIPATHNDDALAISLLSDLATLEMALLRKLAPGLSATELKAMHWDSAGTEIYIPLWRKQAEQFRTVLGTRTIGDLPDLLNELAALGDQMPDPPGTLLTREQRVGRATQALGFVLTLALVDQGWHLHFQPGQFHVERADLKLESGNVLASLKSGKLTRADWTDYCQKQGIGAWPLVSGAKLAASA